ETMATSDRRASAASRGAVDLAEAVLLQGRVGEKFDAAVLDVDSPIRNGHPPRAVVALNDPPVRARCEGAGFAPGDRIPVTLTVADPASRRVLFHSP
ncbi:MAG TPA: RNB domain-containing ribonuclease, partial [Rugosimonospora sp.]|nr:RNB domain-containing ribonuclease [Rugosimonospora sp.]